MVPLAHPDHESPYVDFEQREYGRTVKSDISDVYNMEPLVLGDSVAAMGHDEMSYGDMLPSSYKQEVVGMEPCYLANWNVGNWYDESNQRTTQDTYDSITASNYDVTSDYVPYSQHSYSTLDHGGSSSSSALFYENHRGDSFGTNYHMGSFDVSISRINSVDSVMRSVSSSSDHIKRRGSFDSTRKTIHHGYEGSKLPGASDETLLPDMCRADPQDRMSMNEYNSRNDTSLVLHGGSLRPPQSASSLVSSRGELKRELNRVTTDDVATFNTLFEDVRKPQAKRAMQMSSHQMEKDMFEKQSVARHFKPTNENQNNLNTPQASNMSYYDVFSKMNMGSQALNYGHCDLGYLCDPLYVENHKNMTSTPTMRSKLLRCGGKSYSGNTADYTTYQSDACNNGDVDAVTTKILESNGIYNGHHNSVEGYTPGHRDHGLLEQYGVPMMDHLGETPSNPSRCMPMLEPGKVPMQMEAFMEHGRPENLSPDNTREEYIHNVVEDMGAFQHGSAPKHSQDEFFHVGVDGLDHFSGIVEAFKEEEGLSPDMDAATMRRAFEENRYIEDLGNQYDLSRDDSPCEEAYVYMRTNTPDEYGGFKIQKERVTAAPTATSAELCEVLVACSNSSSNYQPSVTWDQSEQAYIVNWWATDEKGSISKRKSRMFSANEYGKAAAYDEAVSFAKFAETQIRPGALLRWYPGFNIPIGTSGRTNLRKVLHMDRMKNTDLCDPVLAANGMKIATKSTFGDMTIVELYKAAYVLGLWDVAAYNCLKTCKRRSYSYRWIHQLQLMNRRITLDALKYLRNVRESLAANKKPKRTSRGSVKRAAR
ncbi:hypothetical protein BgAZ_403540 [Babesia gibsoni]|uniref:Uncharacterized protein n=1 Tax=Babesia gibsoni TaxID=33632 RepID=A0AAD8PD43_BABGI|nr:hypothetical protein BgAZ_403540 [Babesia gibsoni]